jgi:hypothetical protein
MMDTPALKNINTVKSKHGKKSLAESAGCDETNLLDFTGAGSSSSISVS